MRKSLRKKDNIWWNSALASLGIEARRAWRKAIKTKQEQDWKTQKIALAYFKKLSKEQSAIYGIRPFAVNSRTLKNRVCKKV